MTSDTTVSIHEAAVAYANDILYNINANAAEMIGVDVLWFRATPDKKNQDVIFQTYTLYGVNDCPLTIKAVYTDLGYDEAALTYSIMGMEYAVPLTLEIPVKTWYEATEHDGTIPQRGDIVFIPVSKKLVEVVSMTPVKALGAQVTSFKMNCSAYKPKRSVVVGENLKASIEENTVGQDSVFGEEIKNTMEDITDKKQLDIYSGTSQDNAKDTTKNVQDDSIFKKPTATHSGTIEVDGHLVARSYYNLDVHEDIVVRYKNSSDKISYGDSRCLSAWLNVATPSIRKNISQIIPTEEYDDDCIVLSIKGAIGMEVGDPVMIERGAIAITGTVTSKKPYKVSIRKSVYDDLCSRSTNWYKVPGFIISKVKPAYLIDSDKLSVSIVGNRILRTAIDGYDYSTVLQESVMYDRWHAFVVNIGKTISIDVYTDKTLEKVISISGIKVRKFNDLSIDGYRLRSSNALLTNIRLYTVANTNEDKKIEDVVSYMAPNSSLMIVNDSADLYISDPYTGKQR